MTIHIATSEELGRVVGQGLGEPVLSVADNLLVGPCAAAAQAHVQARCDHWGLRGRERTGFLESFCGILEALEGRGGITLWTSPRWADTMTLWALCAWRLVAWPTEPDVAFVVLGGPAGEEGDGFDTRYLRVKPAEARHGREGVRSLSLTRLREMARSWRKLAGSSPLLARKGASLRPPLEALAAYQAGFFPGLAGPRLALSRFDELLFSCVGERLSTPLEVFVRRGADGEELRKWLRLTGDVFLATRLAQWANHRGADAALESEPYQAENFMKAARYRLSKAGQAIRRQGLTSLERGAPLTVWGATAYDPLAPWVVVSETAGPQRLRKLEGHV